MYSIGFPDMFSGNKSSVVTIKDHDATMNNLILMLRSDKTSLFGDPYFGTNLRKVFHSQNSPILKDLIIDDIYTSIKQFMPQLEVARSDIAVVQQDTQIYATIRALNKLDFTTDMYSILLMEAEANM